MNRITTVENAGIVTRFESRADAMAIANANMDGEADGWHYQVATLPRSFYPYLYVVEVYDNEGFLVGTL